MNGLSVEISANVARFQSDMARVSSIAEQHMRAVDRATNLVATSLKTLGAGFALGLSIEKVKSAMDSAIASAAGMQQLAERTGGTVEKLSGLASVAKLSGTGADELAGGIQKLSKAMIDAQNGGKATGSAFEAIGIGVASLKGMRPDDAFQLIAQKLAGYADGAEKTAVAQALLGKSGANLLPVMHDLAAAGDLQAKVTTRQAAMADDYEKTLLRLNASQGAVFKTLGLAVMPAMDAFARTMLESATATNGAKKAADELARDGSLANWAETGALAVGTAAESIAGVAKAALAVGSSFRAVAADVEFLWTVGRASSADLGKAMFGGTGPVAEALAARNKVIEDANKRYSDLWNQDSTAFTKRLREQFAMIRQRAVEDRGFVPGGSGKPTIAFNPRGDAPGADSGDRFVEQLQRQVEQMQHGRMEMLRLEAAQKGVSAAAAPYIRLLEEVETRQAEIRRIVEATAKAEEQRSKVVGLIDTGNSVVKGINAETEALGLNAEALELLTVRRSIDAASLEAQRGASADTVAEILMITAKLQENAEAAVKARQARDAFLKSDPNHGAKTAGEKWIKDAADQAKYMETLITGSLKRGEDAFIQFCRAGKLQFGELAAFMAETFLRQKFKEFTKKTLFDETGNLLGLGQIVSNIGGFFGIGHANGLDYVPYDGYTATLHRGERVQTAVEASATRLGASGRAGTVFDFSGQVLNVGQGVSRGEVAAALKAQQAATEANIRRQMAQGTWR